MLTDSQLPPTLPAPSREPRQLAGVTFQATSWTPDLLRRLATQLSRAGETLRSIPKEDLLQAWSETVEELLDPSSPLRQELDPALARLCRLSPEGLSAGIEAVLGGVRREEAAKLFETATPSRRTGFVLVVLASNLPALAAQPLLPALAVGRPVLLKSPSSEPLFTPAFLSALCRREPRLAEAVAAVTWPGGDAQLESPVLDLAETVVAYGGGETMRSLETRVGSRLVAYGPKISLAIVGAGVDPAQISAGLARDIALFDQRGCLSIQAIYTAGNAETLANELAHALTEQARRWPPGPIDAAAAAQVQQLRAEAEMRGLFAPVLPLAAGTVIVDPAAELHPSPGLRTVRIHPIADLAHFPELLEPWHGLLQGAALAGEDAWRLIPALERLGISRFAAPGELQSPGASWHNGGISPLAALG